ncbi:hypothetical protein [Pseudorhodobacter wandonensis]|uniref:hypothetical protein n=1 Tax=Pseudorhodobacter wandonensis TaxID=1120568 RepID=UPI0012E12C19|nr:hypothetical protein [Pseudorhodobacter wandonensis]
MLVVGRLFLKTCELVTTPALNGLVSVFEIITDGSVRFLPSRRGIHARIAGSPEFAGVDLETIGAMYAWAQHRNFVVFALEWQKPNGLRKNYAFMKMQVIVLKDVLSG